MLQAITRRVAVRFMDALPEIAGSTNDPSADNRSLSPVTLNKYLWRLSRYWDWLVRRDELEVNVWDRLKLTEPKMNAGEPSGRSRMTKCGGCLVVRLISGCRT